VFNAGSLGQLGGARVRALPSVTTERAQVDCVVQTPICSRARRSLDGGAVDHVESSTPEGGGTARTCSATRPTIYSSHHPKICMPLNSTTADIDPISAAFAWAAVSRSPLPFTACGNNRRKSSPCGFLYRALRNAWCSRAANLHPLGSDPAMINHQSVCAKVMQRSAANTPSEAHAMVAAYGVTHVRPPQSCQTRSEERETFITWSRALTTAYCRTLSVPRPRTNLPLRAHREQLPRVVVGQYPERVATKQRAPRPTEQAQRRHEQDHVARPLLVI